MLALMQSIILFSGTEEGGKAQRSQAKPVWEPRSLLGASQLTHSPGLLLLVPTALVPNVALQMGSKKRPSLLCVAGSAALTAVYSRPLTSATVLGFHSMLDFQNKFYFIQGNS